jgi:hypothetical protein
MNSASSLPVFDIAVIVVADGVDFDCVVLSSPGQRPAVTPNRTEN